MLTTVKEARPHVVYGKLVPSATVGVKDTPGLFTFLEYSYLTIPGVRSGCRRDRSLELTSLEDRSAYRPIVARWRLGAQRGRLNAGGVRQGYSMPSIENAQPGVQTSVLIIGSASIRKVILPLEITPGTSSNC